MGAEPEVSRRSFLKTAGQGVGKLVIAGAVPSGLILGEYARALADPASAASPPNTSPDFPLTNGYVGHFYTQTGGGEGKGYALLDDSIGKFDSTFEQLGGVSVFGYPKSSRFILDGFVYQATQDALFQANPALGRVVLANTLDLMSDKGKDTWLRDQGIPLPIKDDGSTNFDQAKAIRGGWLLDDQIKQKYLANPNPSKITNWDPTTDFGLPSSKPEDMGDFIAQRFQRVAILRWTKQVPKGQPVGTIQFANVGKLACDCGLVPAEAQQATPYSQTNFARVINPALGIGGTGPETNTQSDEWTYNGVIYTSNQVPYNPPPGGVGRDLPQLERYIQTDTYSKNPNPGVPNTYIYEGVLKYYSEQAGGLELDLSSGPDPSRVYTLTIPVGKFSIDIRSRRYRTDTSVLVTADPDAAIRELKQDMGLGSPIEVFDRTPSGQAGPRNVIAVLVFWN